MSTLAFTRGVPGGQRAAASAALAVLVLHRANIARLRDGTETRFRFRRPASAP